MQLLLNIMNIKLTAVISHIIFGHSLTGSKALSSQSHLRRTLIRSAFIECPA